MSAFGPRLRQLRLRHGLTQSDLAGASGLGQSTISSLETGRQRPWPSTRLALARAFRLTPESFDEAIAGANGTALSASTAATPDVASPFASAKVLELLDALGRSEAALARLDALANVVAALWIADGEHRLIAAAGPLADALTEPIGRSVADLLGQSEIPAVVRDAAAGRAADDTLEVNGIATRVHADPHPEGSSGVAIRVVGRPTGPDR